MKWNELDEYEEEERNKLSPHSSGPVQLPAARRIQAVSEMDMNDAIKNSPVPLSKLVRLPTAKARILNEGNSVAETERSECVQMIREGLLSTSPRDSSFEWWHEENDLKTGYNSEVIEGAQFEDVCEASKEGLESALPPLPNDSFDDDIVSGVWGLSGGRKSRKDTAIPSNECRKGRSLRYSEAGAWLGRTAASLASGVGETAVTIIKRTRSLRLRKQNGPKNSQGSETKSASGAFILLPDGMRRRAWDALGLILLVLLLLVQAVNERWRKQHNGWLYADVQIDNPHLGWLLKIKVLLDCFYMADIFVNFRTAYQDKDGKVVKDPWKIAAHYAVHWLIFDLVCALPLDLLLDDKDLHHSARARPGFWGWMARRTRALAFMRRANQTSPFRVSRRMGQIVTHVKRTLRAFGGLSPALRGLRHAQQVVSIKSVVQGVRLLRSVGVIQLLSAAPLVRTLMGSFTFIRLLVSVKARGAVSALLSFLPRQLRGKQDPKMRGENPLVKILSENNPFSPEGKVSCKHPGVARRSNSGKRKRAE